MTNSHNLDDIKKEFSQWMSSHWNPELSLREWREAFVDSGWSVPQWPENLFGRGLPAWSEGVVSAELKLHVMSKMQPVMPHTPLMRWASG